MAANPVEDRLSLMQTVEASSSNLRERFSLIGSIVSECFSSTWAAEPVGAPRRPSTVSWASADGVVVSRAQMAPVRLVNSCGSVQRKRKYYASIADQASTIRLPGSPAMHVQPNEMVILSSQMPSEWLVGREYEHSCLIIEEDLFHEIVPHHVGLVGRRLNLPLHLQETLKSMIDSAWSLSCSGMFDETGPRLARSFLEMLSVASLSKPPVDRPDERVLSKALDVRRAQVKAYIKRHFYDADLSVGAIAQGLSLSPRYVQLAFARENITPSEYIRNMRLEACARLLRDGGEDHRSITEISFACGFNSSSYFSTEFRKHFGLSPREFRANARDRARVH
ncbi:MAG: feaR 2 [Sphingomonas bacterium]|nr:feaR 2 [Sphingomonas bacterium]